MPMDLAQLEKKLRSGKGVPCVVLLGGDEFLREQCRKVLVEHFVPEGPRDWGVTRYSACDVDADEVIRQAQSLPLLSPAQVLIVDGIESWQKGSGEEQEKVASSKAKERSAADSLAQYLEDPSPFSTLVLEAVKLDERMKLFKVLSEHALLVSTNLSEAKDEDKRRAEAIAACQAFLPKIAEELGVVLDAAAAEDLAEASNGSLAQARVELEKVALYAEAQKRITAEDVERLVFSARQFSVWQFATILAQRDRKKALIFLDSLLREGEEPVKIIGAMAWMYRTLLSAQELPRGTSAGQAAGRLRMRYDTAELALREAPRIPRERLTVGLRALAEADNRLKSGNPDDGALMEFLATQLTA